MAELSKKHQAFVDAYFLRKFNASEAYSDIYKKASPDTCRINGSILLSNTNIQTEISKRQAENRAKYNITQERILDEIFELMKSCKAEGLDGTGIIKDRSNWAKCIDMMSKIGGIYAAEKHDVNLNSEQPLFSSLTGKTNNE